jgi:hypothetical protein
MGPKTAASVLAGARSSGTETPAEPEETGVVVQNSEVSLSVTLDAAKSLRDLIDRQIRILETRETRGENRETGSETRRRSKAKK